MTRKLLLIFILLLSNCSMLLSQDDANHKLKVLQEKFNSLKDFSVDFSRTSNSKKDLSGKMFYKSKNKIRLEMQNTIVVSDSKSIWNFNKKDKKVFITNADDDSQSFLSLDKLVNQYPSECKINLIKVDAREVIELTPGNSNLQFIKILMWTNSDNLLSKVIIEDQAIGKMELNFAGYKLNSNIADSKFSFTPPEGSTVIDLR